MHNRLITSLLRCRLVSISRGGKLVVPLSALYQISFSPTSITFLLILLLCILLRKSSLIWIIFCAKLHLETSRHAISLKLSICYWNLNNIATHNYAKLSLLKSHNLVHSFDIICLSEIYLNSETPLNDTCPELTVYNLFCSDHNNKRGGVCIYYKSTLSLRILNISNTDECINFEVSIANKICRFIQLYKSLSMSFKHINEI